MIALPLTHADCNGSDDRLDGCLDRDFEARLREIAADIQGR
jgi:hypothetical protein